MTYNGVFDNNNIREYCLLIRRNELSMVYTLAVPV